MTKADLVEALALAPIKVDIIGVRRDIELLEQRMVINVGGMVMALGGLLLAVKFLSR